MAQTGGGGKFSQNPFLILAGVFVTSKSVPFELVLRDQEVAEFYAQDKLMREAEWRELRCVWSQYYMLSSRDVDDYTSQTSGCSHQSLTGPMSFISQKRAQSLKMKQAGLPCQSSPLGKPLLTFS